jgi:hypothetical protein
MWSGRKLLALPPWLTFNPEDIASGIISQKRVFFIATAMRT